MNIGPSFFFVAGVVLSSSAQADDCTRIRANIDTTIDAASCTSPVGLCAAGEITRNGLLSGTTYFTGEGLGGGAVGEESIVSPPIVPDTTWTYAGTLVITTCDGTLTLEDVGVYDTVGRPYSEYQTVVDGTGVFAGASGTLFSYGWAKEDGSGFRGRLRGKICWPDAWDADAVDDQSDDDVAELDEDGEDDDD